MHRLAIIFLIITAGCSKDDAEKGCVPIDKALGQVASLSNIAEKGLVAGRPDCSVYAGARIFACRYQEQTAYSFSNPASSLSTCGFIVYDCFGDEIINRATDEAAWTAFEAKKTNEELLWEKK